VTLFIWYVVRASGIVAFLALTSSVVLGLALSGRARLPRWPRFALEDVHGYAGVVAGIFVVLHGSALLLDRYIGFSLGQLLVPGTSSYRPLAVAAGVVAAELLAALAITNRLRSRLPHGAWRRAHYLNFAVWSLALVHGLTAGADARTVWALSLYGIAAGAVAGLTARRVLRTRPLPDWGRALWPAAAAVVAVELVVTLAELQRSGGG
jgi:sulfoxide reductase heme-binding subunit YedZ